MRAVFGLAGLLITLAVVVLVLKYAVLPETQNAAMVQKTVRPQVEQLAGRDTEGNRAAYTVELTADSPTGRFNALVVSRLTSGGGMEKWFGLQVGDRIIEVNQINVNAFGDAETAKLQVLDAFQKRLPLTVERSGKRLTLPLPPVPPTVVAQPQTPQPQTPQPQAAPPQTGTPAVNPPAAEPRKPKGNPLYDQLDAIQRRGQ